MIKDFKPAKWEEYEFYELVFLDENNCGFSFSCDKNGNVELTELQRKNYELAMSHPEMFVQFNKVVKFTNRYKKDASGVCDCGHRIELYDQYLGACECPHCGRWYNLFGQSLKNPDEWEEVVDDYLDDWGY